MDAPDDTSNSVNAEAGGKVESDREERRAEKDMNEQAGKCKRNEYWIECAGSYGEKMSLWCLY